MRVNRVALLLACAMAFSLAACADRMIRDHTPQQPSSRGETVWHLLPTNSATWATEPLPSPPVELLAAHGTAALAYGRFARWRFAYDGGGHPTRLVDVQIASRPADLGVTWSPSGKWASNETERDFCDLVDSASIPDHTFAYAMIGICRGQNELGRIVVLLSLIHI